MNETIGEKGGKNDRRRQLLITKKQKKKLQEYNQELEKKHLEHLEKKVKQIQRLTFIKAFPIVLTGEVFKVIYENSQKQAKINKEEVFSTTNLKNHDTDITNVEKKEIAFINPNYFYTDKLEKAFSERTIEEKASLTYKITPKNATKVEVKEKKQEEIPLLETPLEENNNFQALKNKKIIESYENKLKEARKDLRNSNFVYTVISTEEQPKNKGYNEMIEGISTIINKIDQLKDKIKVENEDSFDSNYLTYLIDNYLADIKENGYSDENSEIYQLLSAKLEEINSKNDSITEVVEVKKEQLRIKEIDLEALKEKYYNYAKFNTMLLEFQNEQDYLLRQVQEKMQNAVSVEEKVKVEMEAMDLQSRRLMRLLTLQMFLPGPRGAKGFATAAATYLYFVNNIIKPKKVVKKYKVINVQDYSKDIENSLSAIEDISVLLRKTSKELNKTLATIKEDFKDYIGVLPECDSLIAHLEKVRDELHEKEYEISTIEKEQKKNLEKNNAKVLKYKYNNQI